jgi:hypothetical protein
VWRPITLTDKAKAVHWKGDIIVREEFHAAQIHRERDNIKFENYRNDARSAECE